MTTTAGLSRTGQLVRTVLTLTLTLGTPPATAADASSAPTVQPTRVLLLHSFGHDFAPYRDFTERFRAELARRAAVRLEFYDVSYLAARQSAVQDDEPFVDYLHGIFASRPPDLVVPIGGAAVRFAQRQRQRLFSASPMLFAAVDQRVVEDRSLAANDAVVAVRNDFAAAVANILEVLPETTRLAVVLGDSPIERYWVEEMRRDLRPFAQRLELDWLNKLSFEEMKQHVATLPPRSAILFALLSVDAAGVAHAQDDALGELSLASKAPVFGLFEAQLGLGIVGGRLISNRVLADTAAGVSVRVLEGSAPGPIKTPALGPGTPEYDWRALRRWGIDERSLPPGSIVRFREPTLWERYAWYVAAVAGVFVLQAALIATLLLQRRRRRRAERDALALTGRLLTAHEDERRRLGRELHDDVTQRLACLAIDAAKMESGGRVSEGAAHSLHEELVRLSEDIHALSYRLHPSVIEDLGLVEALRAECDNVAGREPIRLALDAGEIPRSLPLGAAVCLFRVAQEALRNVVRHARASTVDVSLEPRNGGLRLTVKDNGAGFDPAQNGSRASLGHASMRERVRFLGGKLDIHSAPGRGTTVIAWVPLGSAPS